jgi:transposase-like protein
MLGPGGAGAKRRRASGTGDPAESGRIAPPQLLDERPAGREAAPVIATAGAQVVRLSSSISSHLPVFERRSSGRRRMVEKGGIRLLALVASDFLLFSPHTWHRGIVRERTGEPKGGRDYPRNWRELHAFFPDDAACARYLAKLRWWDGFRCRWCDHGRYWLRSDGRFQCAACGRRSSVTAGTLFAKTRTPLRTWFAAIWYVTNQSSGVSALGLQQVLGLGSYETAWAMLHRLRRAMTPTSGKLRGVVEVDESFIGGKEAGVRGRLTQKKARVIIAVERGGGRGAAGRVRMRQIPDFRRETLLAFIRDEVADGSEVVTDGLAAYRSLDREGYRHTAHNIKRSGKQAHELMPAVHRVSGLVKRWILGTHQGAVSQELLDYYLAEFAFRFNRRYSTHRGLLFFNLIRQAAATAPAEYADLLTADAGARRRRTVQRARARRAGGEIGAAKNTPRRRPRRPGGRRTTLQGDPTVRGRFIVAGRQGANHRKATKRAA